MAETTVTVMSLKCDALDIMTSHGDSSEGRQNAYTEQYYQPKSSGVLARDRPRNEESFKKKCSSVVTSIDCGNQTVLNIEADCFMSYKLRLLIR